MKASSHDIQISSVEINAAGQLLVSGCLNFATVPQLAIRGCQLIAASPQPVFDLHGVTKSDNAGLALLVAWVKCAKRMRKAVKFSHIPQQLLAIAKVSGLQSYFYQLNENKNG